VTGGINAMAEVTISNAGRVQVAKHAMRSSGSPPQSPQLGICSAVGAGIAIGMSMVAAAVAWAIAPATKVRARNIRNNRASRRMPGRVAVRGQRVDPRSRVTVTAPRRQIVSEQHRRTTS
jgi:hypothetical protein